MAAGAAWMIGMRLCITALGVVSTLILARLLQPSDFGLVALATAIVAALELLTEFRLDFQLIQNQNASRADYDSAWTLNLILGGMLGILLLAASAPAAYVFHEPRLSNIVCVLAVSRILDGAQNIGIVNFRKDLKFGMEFTFATVRKLSGVLVAVTCAWTFRSYWALAAGIVTSSVVGVAASFLMHTYRPRPRLTSARRLLSYSKWLLIDSLIQFLRTRSSDLLIGRFAGAHSLGLFNVAQETATLAQSTVTAPTNRAILPAYARLQGDLESLRNSFLAVVGMTTLVAVPMAVGVAAVAPLLVPALLGDQWQGSITLMELLAFASALSTCGSGAPIVYLALGRPKLLVLLGAADISILLLGMGILLPKHGAMGAAWATLIAASAILPVRLALVQSVLGSVLRQWLGAVWRPVTSAAAMYLLIAMLHVKPDETSGTLSQLLNLAELVGVGITSYITMIFTLWWLAGRPPGAEKTVTGLIRRSLYSSGKF